jgi:signal transduction histidine kinase/ligand-binding sensor domain-containing protein
MLKYFKSLFLKLLLLLLSFTFTYSQTVEPNFDVLPVVTPRGMYQDSFGFLWISSFEGLLCYDGYTLKKYSNIPFDSTSLSYDWVFSIIEDEKKNLWIGTMGGGLNYFDRRREIFTHYNSKTLAGMSDNILKIIVNEDGSLWLGSAGHGLIWFNRDRTGKVNYKCYPVTDQPVQHKLPSNNVVQDLLKNKQGLLWLATAVEGLIRFNPETGEMIKFKHDPNDPKSISSNVVSCICEDDSGNLWLGTGHTEFPPGHGEGLNMYNQKTGVFKLFKYDPKDKNSICSNNISSLLIDHSGTLWIGSWDNYLNSVPVQDLITNDNPQFKHYTDLSQDMVISLYEDHLYNIWIGIFGLKLYKIDYQKNHFEFYSRTDKYPASLTHPDVTALCVDHLGRIWFGTRGLDEYDLGSGRYSHHNVAQVRRMEFGQNLIAASIEEDHEGNLWIATRTNGITIFNPKTGAVRYLKHREGETGGLLDNAVRYLLKRPNGDLWIATAQSTIQLYQKKTGKFYNYNLEPQNQTFMSILALCEDRDGVLWIGTMSHGMFSLRVKDYEMVSVEKYQHNPQNRKSLSNIQVQDIMQPQVVDTNALWLATMIGLNRFDLKTRKFTHFFQKDGLASDIIMRILEDKKGNLWCAAFGGLSVYDIRTGDIKSYGKADGMPFTDYSNLGRNSARGPDGKLYFSGMSGTLGFNPEEMQDNPNIPPVVLTDFKIFGEHVKLDTAILFKKVITLPFSDNAFSFEFAALNFTNPEKNQYAYKMEGFHDDWIYAGNERKASFTNLDPGKYVFQVKGSNNHSLWNEEGTTIKVIILPPWWQTIWAYIGYIFLFGTILFSSVRFELQRRQRKLELQLQREQELRKMEEAEHRAVVAELEQKTAEAHREAEKEQMRSRIASDLHDEIGGNLSSIALLGQVLQEKLKIRAPLKQKLQEIPRIARLTAESMRDIVWFINPENDDWDKLLAKMRETANLMLESIDFTFTIPRKAKSLETDLDFRRNLYLIYKESLQNIVKHSQAQKVHIELRQENSSLVLSITDDGIGFDTSTEYPGNGLKNLQRRATDINGKIEVLSGIGRGTTISFTKNIP